MNDHEQARPGDEGFRMGRVPADDRRIFCTSCGQTLATHDGTTCSQCGAPVEDTMRAIAGPPAVPMSAMAVTSMCLGIVSIPGCLCLGIGGVLFGVPAIITGAIARSHVSRGIASRASNSYALAGIWCGVVGVGLGLCGFAGQVLQYMKTFAPPGSTP